MTLCEELVRFIETHPSIESQYKIRDILAGGAKFDDEELAIIGSALGRKIWEEEIKK